MQDFFEDFKPIRNKLTKINLHDVLDFISNETKRDEPRIIPETINFLYSNALIYCDIYGHLNNANAKKEIFRIIKDIEELNFKVVDPMLSKTGLDCFVKLYENQTIYKSSSFYYQLFRYYNIYSNSVLSSVFKEKFGFEYKDFMQSAVILQVLFLENWKVSAIELEKLIVAQTLNSEKSLIENLNKTLNILSVDIEIIKEELKCKIKYDENMFFQYGYHHLVKPIIKVHNALCCPNNRLLINQFTSGMYYILAINSIQGIVGNEYGKAFEKYIGLVLERNNIDKLRILSEPKYHIGKQELKSSDWIVIENESIVMIECKTKRKQISDKLYDIIEVEHANSYAVDILFQIYQRINDYINNRIDNLKFSPIHNIIPIIVFLEDDLYLDLDHRITNLVKQKLKDKGIIESLVEQYPPHYYTSSMFESDVPLMFKYGFSNFFSMKSNNEISIDSDDYKQAKNIFEDDFKDLFINPFQIK